MTSYRLLRLAGVYIPLGVLAAIVVPFIFFWARLPEPLATHWSRGPDSSMPRLLELSLVGGLWSFFAARTAWSILKPAGEDEPSGKRGRHLVPPLTTMYFVAGVLLFSHGLVLWGNLDATHWRAAKHVDTVATIVGVLSAALLASAIGSTLERALSDGQEEEGGTTPAALDLHGNERVVWWAHATNRWLQVTSLAASAFVFFAASSESSQVVRYGVPLVTTTVGILFSSVHVVVGHRDLTIELGALRWPRKVIAIRDIERVEVRHIHPLRHGGWGYRSCGSRCRAIIIRAGDALVLSQRDGRTTIVTVDTASDGAAALQAALNDRRSA